MSVELGLLADFWSVTPLTINVRLFNATWPLPGLPPGKGVKLATTSGPTPAEPPPDFGVTTCGGEEEVADVCDEPELQPVTATASASVNPPSVRIAL
jgi:hypothetical protein